MWHIQTGVFGHYEEQKLKQALDNLDLTYAICDNNEVLSTNRPWGQNNSVTCFRGAVEFIQPMRHRYINAFRENAPVCVTIENYSCSVYYPKWLEWLLNRDHFFVPWITLKDDAQQYFEWLNCEKLFIRPNSGRKIFTGNYISKKWWENDLETIASLPGNNPSDNDLVLVSSHKGIVSEYRVIMYEDEVLTYSWYDGNETCSLSEAKIKDYCTAAAWSSNYFPDEYYTLDLALLQDGSMKVLELNSLFSAGWYDADYDKIIKHVEEHL